MIINNTTTYFLYKHKYCLIYYYIYTYIPILYCIFKLFYTKKHYTMIIIFCTKKFVYNITITYQDVE